MFFAQYYNQSKHILTEQQLYRFKTTYACQKMNEQKESPKHTHSSILRTFSSLN